MDPKRNNIPNCKMINNRLMRRYSDVLLTILITATLMISMLWPIDELPPNPNSSDKIIHFVAFATLAFPLSYTGRIGLLLIFIVASSFGGIIELVQPTFNRSSDINDWIADIAGTFFGIACGVVYRRLRTHK